METDELLEIREKVHTTRERAIGLTMAVFAAFLATVTLMGHRLHTEEVVAQTKAADGWAFYQAKNGRYHMYAADAKLALLIGPQGQSAAEDWKKKADEERHDADEIRRENEHLDAETTAIARRATFFDASEICLEVAIVLCSVALLTGIAIFWQVSFLGTLAGVAIAAMGYFR